MKVGPRSHGPRCRQRAPALEAAVFGGGVAPSPTASSSSSPPRPLQHASRTAALEKEAQEHVEFGEGSLLPTELLVPLLYGLRGAYASPAVQRQLREAASRRGAGEEEGGRCGGRNQAYLLEQKEILAKVQAPIFRRFKVAPPPTGVWVVLASIIARQDEWEVCKIGNQCRRLLGQMDGEGAVAAAEDAAAAAAAYAASYEGEEQSPWDWLPAPAASRSLEAAGLGVSHSKTHGEGLVACRSFKPGEQIFSEPPLAVLHCGGVTVAGAADAARELWFSGRVATVLQSSLYRGPPDERRGPKARACGDLAQLALEGYVPMEVAGLYVAYLDEALRAFGYNAYAAPGDAAQVLYAAVCKANHSCAPNASVITSATAPGQLVCVRPIAPGDEVTVSYLPVKDLHKECKQRRRQLQQGWEFCCSCSRCTSESSGGAGQERTNT